MNIFLYIKQAFSALRSNKLRSFLSTLWIVIWIMSFVIMLAIWESTKKTMLEQFGKTANVISIYQNVSWESKKDQKNIFENEIVDEILKKVPNVKKAVLNYTSIWQNVIYKWTSVDAWTVYPVEQNFFDVKEAPKILWTYFSEEDFKNNQKSAIIWELLVKKVFKQENPIWKKISIGWELFLITWVLKEKDYGFDNNIFIPKTTSSKYFWKPQIDYMQVIVNDEKIFDDTKNKLNVFLFKKTWVEKYNDVNYRIQTNKELIKQLEQWINWFTYFLLFIWWISLLVGWIWIMNIMLVSVTERTREIWIRKAIWASNFSILLQFLIESIILTFVWSSLAIIFSYIFTYALGSALDSFWIREVTIDFYVLIVAVSVAIFMWILFGIMPAYKAARLKPIDALHFE